MVSLIDKRFYILNLSYIFCNDKKLKKKEAFLLLPKQDSNF